MRMSGLTIECLIEWVLNEHSSIGLNVSRRFVKWQGKN
jgi:hypothetical protein